MKILAIDGDVNARSNYALALAVKQHHEVHLLPELPEKYVELDAKEYDVVILDDENITYKITNIPLNHIVVAGKYVSPKKTGTWGITKPFVMHEIIEILEVIEEGSNAPWPGDKRAS